MVILVSTMFFGGGVNFFNWLMLMNYFCCVVLGFSECGQLLSSLFLLHQLEMAIFFLMANDSCIHELYPP